MSKNCGQVQKLAEKLILWYNYRKIKEGRKMSQVSRRRGKLKNAFITPHAIDRFIERWRPLDMYDEVPKTMDEWVDKCRAVLLGSQEASQDRVDRVLQLINHGEVGRYFINEKYGLRFIVVKGDASLVVKTVIWRGQNYRPEDIQSFKEGGAQ